eukprot:2897427-Rhodomonas_salina.3
MDSNQKGQNFDSRTLALLNRLASRRQSTPSNPTAQRPDSAKVEPNTASKGNAAARNSSSSPGLRVGTPIDLSGKGQAGVQRPASAARVGGLQKPQMGASGTSSGISAGMN